MTKKLYLPLVLLMVFSMLLAACGPAVAPVADVAIAQPTVAPATAAPPAPIPPTEEPVPDIAALYTVMVNSLPQGYAGIKPADVSAAMAEATPPFLLDVRDAAELEKDGYIKGAVNIPVRNVLKNLDKLPGLDAKIIVYCGSGQRGGMLLGALRLIGYTNVLNMSGGLAAWKKANLAVETGSMPAEAKAISTPVVADKALFDMVDGFLSTLPDGFLAVKTDKVMEEMTSATPPVLVDLRTPEERVSGGYIKGSINIPVTKLFTSLDQLPAKDAPMIVYCGSGQRGSIALTGLHLLGYTKAVNMSGGLTAWKTASLPLEGVVDWMAVWTEFLTNMPSDYYTVKADVLNGQIAAGSAPFLIDVRDASEIEAAGYIKGAVNLPLRNLLQNLDKLPAQDQPIVIYCGSGHRGGMAMSALRLLGYTDVRNLGGGLGAWTKANLALEKGQPAAPVAGTASTVDPIRLANLNSFLSTLPDGFFSMKAADVNTAVTSATPPVVIDLRTADEFKTGYIKGSVNIPINVLLADMTKLPSDKAAAIITVCGSGHRGAIAMMALRMLGYTNVNSLSKGINGWGAENLPLEK
jgi:rhodanese-related sulfurtransferase